MSDSLSQTSFLKGSCYNGKECIINEKYIRFIAKDNHCFLVCSKMNGCKDNNFLKVCKNENLEAWQTLNKLFY
jgi:hypothetical protein